LWLFRVCVLMFYIETLFYFRDYDLRWHFSFALYWLTKVIQLVNGQWRCLNLFVRWCTVFIATLCISELRYKELIGLTCSHDLLVCRRPVLFAISGEGFHLRCEAWRNSDWWGMTFPFQPSVWRSNSSQFILMNFGVLGLPDARGLKTVIPTVANRGNSDIYA